MHTTMSCDVYLKLLLAECLHSHSSQLDKSSGGTPFQTVWIKTEILLSLPRETQDPSLPAQNCTYFPPSFVIEVASHPKKGTSYLNNR